MTAWLLGSSVALVLVGQVIIARVLTEWDRLPAAYRSLSIAMAAAGAAALALGWLAPAPWLLALALGLILLVLWFAAVIVFIRADAWPPP